MSSSTEHGYVLGSVKFSYHLEHNTITVYRENSPVQTCILDKDNQFIYNNERWMLYRSPVTWRLHYDLMRYVDVPMPNLLHIIPLEKAKMLVELFCGLTNPVIMLIYQKNNTPYVEVSNDLSKITEKFKTHLIQFLSSTKKLGSFTETNLDDNTKNLLKVIEQGISFIDHIDVDYIYKGFISSNPVNCQIGIDNKPFYVIYEYIMNIIHYILNFDQCFINSQSFNSELNYMLRFLLLMNTYYSFTSIESGSNSLDLFFHYFLCGILDIITDRTSRELFIDKRHQGATELRTYFEYNYPFLKKFTSPSKMKELMQNGKVNKTLYDKFVDEIKDHNIKLYPFILTWNFELDMDRFKFIYKEIKKEMKKDNNRLFSNFNIQNNNASPLTELPDPDKCYNECFNYIQKHMTSGANLYKLHDLVDIIPMFFGETIFDDNKNYEMME